MTSNVIVLSVLITLSTFCNAQCPDGLKSAGQLSADGSFGSNYTGVKEVLLPPGTVLDTSYHQQQPVPFENGQEDAHSHFTLSRIPAGIWIRPHGDNGGWAVGDGPEPVVYLQPAVWDMNTNSISQYKFGMRLYCTTGSAETRRFAGGCNVKVDVCYKPKISSARLTNERGKATVGE